MLAVTIFCTLIASYLCHGSLNRCRLFALSAQDSAFTEFLDASGGYGGAVVCLGSLPCTSLFAACGGTNGEADIVCTDSASDDNAASATMFCLFISAAQDSASSTLLNSPGGYTGVEVRPVPFESF